MDDIDNLHKIKDFLNMILVNIHGCSGNELITDVISLKEALPSKVSEDAIMIVYEYPTREFNIGCYSMSNPDTLIVVLEKILGVHKISDYIYNIDDIYQIIESLFEYSNEELELYFKLS